MNCNVVKDLLPLYLDDCCSEESRKLVEEHIKSCGSCGRLYESMKEPVKPAVQIPMEGKLNRISQWKASVLQSLTLYISFLLVAQGVGMEASVPAGFGNGNWLLALVVPMTALLLSMGNWYFVRFYRRRRAFVIASAGILILVSVGSYLWGAVHYEWSFGDLLGNRAFLIGILLTVFLSALNALLSNLFGKYLGKE